jgi:hypothetical protein
MEDPWQRDGFVFFWHGWPSQWHLSPFEIDGVRYRCCEQFMMAEKARLFGDADTLAEILAAKAPTEHKALGREVAPFDARRWSAACREIVYRGNLAKYEQSASLRALLLATGALVLAEASPSDKIWGIGLAADDPRAPRRAEWPGKNWLGKALMRVRDELRAR